MVVITCRCYIAVRGVLPDIAVGVMDTGEAPVPIGNLGIKKEQVEWIGTAQHLVYMFHHYGSGAVQAIKAALSFSHNWDVPALMTEFGDCSAKVPAEDNGIGWSYWEYSDYCDTAPSKACYPGAACDFGACITGVNGNAWLNLTCNQSH